MIFCQDNLPFMQALPSEGVDPRCQAVKAPFVKECGCHPERSRGGGAVLKNKVQSISYDVRNN
ncbi:MAG: hypothetical protein EXR21_10290 [Flavobacteriaceae bacterium]|nr:hypothetical protein [Flavobacteriaceae bacterium]